MDNWDMDFRPDMIDGSRHIVINCKNIDDAFDCAEVLDDLGVRYGDQEPPTKEVRKRYREHGNDFCFYIEGYRLYYGPKYSTNDRHWCDYEKCTFNGLNVTDISDTSFEDVIGGGE